MEIKVSIVIPAYNEEKIIGKTLDSYCRYFTWLKRKEILDFEIIVAVNNTTDRTIEIIKEFIRSYPEIGYLDIEKGGKGLAIKLGFEDALTRDSDLIGFVDADGSTPPNAFYGLIKHIKDYDGIIANRWDKRSKVSPKQNLTRKILSRGYNYGLRSIFLFPFKDTQCGAKLFKREILKRRLHLMVSSKWNFDVALLFCLLKGGARIKSIPTEWSDSLDSKIDVKRTPLKMAISAIRLRLSHSPFRFIVNRYNRLPESLKIHKRF